MEKSAKSPLHGMFTAVPQHYDLVNRIITLGLDKRWRRLAAEACLESKPRCIIDIGCGTGDMTVNIARLASKDTTIIGLDYSLPMLEKGRQKAENAGVGKQIRFVEGDASHIPLPDVSCDTAVISFAFRNLTYKNPIASDHLAEVFRILKPGGRYVIVESSQPGNSFIRACFHLYLRCFVKPVGTLISRNRSAYRYLTESTLDYYSPAEVKDLLLNIGFKKVSYRPLLFGAAGIHVATR